MNMNFIENEFVDSRLLERENTVDDSDNRKKIGNCLKSMYDTMKETSIPHVTEENWMNGCLISNHSTQTNHNPNHEMITNDLRNLEQELYNFMPSTI